MTKKHNAKTSNTLKIFYLNPRKVGSLHVGKINVYFLNSWLRMDKINKPRTISKWLQTQKAYTLQKPVGQKFIRRSALASGIND